MRLLLLVVVALLVTIPAAPVAAQPGEWCFPETGQCISAGFRAAWESNGGLALSFSGLYCTMRSRPKRTTGSWPNCTTGARGDS